MDELEAGLAIIVVLFMVVLYLGLIALGCFITYLLIKWAINRSKVNQNLEALRMEMQRLNHYLYLSLQGEQGGRQMPPGPVAGGAPPAAPAVQPPSPEAGRPETP